MSQCFDSMQCNVTIILVLRSKVALHHENQVDEQSWFVILSVIFLYGERSDKRNNTTCINIFLLKNVVPIHRHQSGPIGKLTSKPHDPILYFSLYEIGTNGTTHPLYIVKCDQLCFWGALIALNSLFGRVIVDAMYDEATKKGNLVLLKKMFTLWWTRWWYRRNTLATINSECVSTHNRRKEVHVGWLCRRQLNPPPCQLIIAIHSELSWKSQQLTKIVSQASGSSLLRFHRIMFSWCWTCISNIGCCCVKCWTSKFWTVEFRIHWGLLCVCVCGDLCGIQTFFGWMCLEFFWDRLNAAGTFDFQVRRKAAVILVPRSKVALHPENQVDELSSSVALLSPLFFFMGR